MCTIPGLDPVTGALLFGSVAAPAISSAVSKPKAVSLSLPSSGVGGQVTKTADDVKSEAEAERQRLAASKLGIAGTILTGGLGDTTKVRTRGVSLGV